MNKLLRLHHSDNVAVVITSINKGDNVSIDGQSFIAKENIDAGHKMALNQITVGDAIIKYGFSIGVATSNINIGDKVHTHNLKTSLQNNLEYTYKDLENKYLEPVFNDLTIEAYKRNDGQIGIRNELWIIPLVGCINGLADQIAKQFKDENDIAHTDGIFVHKHPWGCSQLGDDLVTTQHFLSSLAKHGNAGGVLLIGLGCENNTLESFLPYLGSFQNSPRIRYLVAQKANDEITEAKIHLSDLNQLMKSDKRETMPFSKLKIGLKCGGSDGFSGITANPLLGSFSDSFVSNGGCVLMSEVPEMFGAETILMDRSKDKEVFKQIVNLINNFKNYFTSQGQNIYENPSPGNKDGGISTLEDKSLGCTQKAGHAKIDGVLNYAQKISNDAKNLWLLDGPGNDLIAVSNLGVAGSHLVLFTTGRGTPFGGFIPTIKIATNHQLAINKANWIDFDASIVLEKGDFKASTIELAYLIKSIASGKQLTKNEMINSREISILKSGVIL